MLAKIKCPACKTEGTMSLVESMYNGPYRCWKCHALYTIELDKNGELVSYKTLGEDELKKQQELKALQDKYKKHD